MKYFIQDLKNLYHFFQALIANIRYGFPSRKLKVIGITGTDGKTTTTHLIYHILKRAGKKVSMISTVYAKVGGREYETGLHTTTPDPFLVQELLHKAVQNGDEYFILENTSHAIHQNRVWGVRYEVGVITNVTHEHLDYHRNFNDYLMTKKIMLQRSRTAVINRDDDSYPLLRSGLDAGAVITYGLIHKADYSMDFRKSYPHLADFNAYNYLAAYAVALSIGIEKDKVVKALESFELPPGRLDMVYSGSFKVMVDFAHTPNAISMILRTVKRIYAGKGNRIIHVFGSAGLRDVSKRPLMGAESASYADLIILTEEDYRTEDPAVICEEIATGITGKGFTFANSLKRADTRKYTIITNRKTAIENAIHLAQPDDIIVITGKGHEKSLCRGTVEYPWSDRQAVQSLLKK